ncbi:MAG: acyl-homoserine-lactone synthase [Hyphomicrobium sp.]|jgi:acyl homoserine lactone synthase
MAEVITVENLHQHGDVLPSMLRLRYREFKERQDYDIPVFKDMEYDAYDTPAASYIVWNDAAGVVRGCSRMAPTDRAYMIRDLWPDMITRIPMPDGGGIWESSRFCIDSRLAPEVRREIKFRILHTKLRYALSLGLQGMVGVMPPPIWRAVFSSSGWPIEPIGEVRTLNRGERVVAGWIGVDAAYLGAIEARAGFELNDGEEHVTRTAHQYLKVAI